MLFQYNFYSSLLLIFFVHGLVYALLLYRKGELSETSSDKWLCFFLLLCTLYIIPWMVGFAGWYDTQPYRDVLFYVPFQHLYFIGPVVFFYVQSLLNPYFRFGKKEWMHLLPGILYILFSVVVAVTDKLVLKRYYFLAGGQDPDFDSWYQLTGLLSMLIYFVLCLRYYTLYRKLMLQVVSYADLITFQWIRNFLIAFLLMLVLRTGFYIANLFVDGDYHSSWWYFLFFALIFYFIAIKGYSNSVKATVPFVPHLLAYKPALLLNFRELHSNTVPQEETTDTIDIQILPAEGQQENSIINEWKAQLLHLMVDEKAYEDPELSLAGVAAVLHTNPSVISKAINQGFRLNFNDFVNQYRIQAIKAMFEKGAHKKQTLLSIAFDCGFNSKATFNRAFKKATGVSPREYIQLPG